MATSVTYNGTVYSVPAAGETGWSSLSLFLIALANTAQTKTTQFSNIRTATSSPVTVVAASDATVIINLSVAGAVSVVLPAGVVGQKFIIVDGKGDANTNNITVTGTGGQTINGSASLIIKQPRGMAIVQWSTVENTWEVLVPAVYAIAGSVVGTTDTQTLTNKIIAGASNTLTVRLGSDVTGTLPIGNGGTGQVTANAALNALLPPQATNSGKVLGTDATNTSWVSALTDPMTARGDIIVRNSSNATARLAVGAARQTLSSDGTDISWTYPSLANNRGADSSGTDTTLVVGDFRNQIFNISVAKSCILPTTGILAGDQFRIENIGSAELGLKSSAGTAFTIANSANMDGTIGVGFIRVMALQNTPTTPAHWQVLEVIEKSSWATTFTFNGGGTVTTSSATILFQRVNKFAVINPQVGTASGQTTAVNGVSTALISDTAGPVRLNVATAGFPAFSFCPVRTGGVPTTVPGILLFSQSNDRKLYLYKDTGTNTYSGTTANGFDGADWGSVSLSFTTA